MKMFGCCILQMRHTTIDSSNLMDLSVTTVEKVFRSETEFQTITFSYNLSHIKLKFSIYSFVHLIDQLTPMGFIILGTFTRTQTMLKYKDFNYHFIATYLK